MKDKKREFRVHARKTYECIGLVFEACNEDEAKEMAGEQILSERGYDSWDLEYEIYAVDELDEEGYAISKGENID